MSFYIQQRNFTDILAKEDALYSFEHAATFDLTHEWFETLAKHTLADNEKVILDGLFDEEKNFLLLLPLVLVNKKQGAVSSKYVQSLSNYYTANYSAVYNNTLNKEEIIEEYAGQLMANYKDIAYVDLNPMDPDNFIYKSLIKGFEKAGAIVEEYFRFGNWYLEVNGQTFSEYYEERPSRVKSTIKRKLKKLSKYSSNIEIKIITNVDELPEAVCAYEDIYAQSWKQDEPYNEFIREIAEKFAIKGWLRFGLVKVDGKPAAAQVWFVYKGTASIFKLAYSPEFKNYSVGSILTVELMKYVIDIDKVDIVDYLCGDDNYKKEWMSDRREKWGIRAYRKFSLFNLLPIMKLLLKKYVPK